MKRFLPLLIGASLLFPPLVRAESEPLYDTVKKSMEAQLRGDDVEQEVADYVEAVSKKKKWGIVADDIEAIMKGENGVCAKHDELKGLDDCKQVLDAVRNLVRRESAIREAGRHMQAIATSYEVPVSEIPRKSKTIIGDLNGVVNLWAASDATKKEETTKEKAKKMPGKVVLIPVKDEVASKRFKIIAEHLNALTKEQRISIVWLLKYGTHQNNKNKSNIAGEYNYNYDDAFLKDCKDSERQYLCSMAGDFDFEDELQYWFLPDFYDLFKAANVASGDVAYLQFEDKTQDLLPDGIILWARFDPFYGTIEAGLDWEYPLEPVLPSLLTKKKEAILGGLYPPEPALVRSIMAKKPKSAPIPFEAEGIGLCNMSMGEWGYLCRPITRASADGCPEAEDGDKDAITLVSCTSDKKDKITKAGPDVCSEILWKDQAVSQQAVCTPGASATYKNTIGNNLCFIGQCAEESMETHRLTGGRTPAGVQDQAFPYDDPLAGSPLGNFLSAPTSGNAVLPPYKPLETVREFEAALCALVGLPAGTPSGLCAIAADRRLASPLGYSASTVLDMIQMQTQQTLTSQDMSSLAESVGTRMGTELYARNLRVMSKSLSEVIGTATQLLNEMKSIDFPTEMCPLGYSPPEPK